MPKYRSKRNYRRRSHRKSGGGPGGPGLPHGTGTGTGTIQDILLPEEPINTMQTGGDLYPLTPSVYNTDGGMMKSQYRTISGGRRTRRRRGNSKRKYRGGNAVIATAALPLGLFALQRYFKGSKTSKQGMQKMGRSFKRTFRRRY